MVEPMYQWLFVGGNLASVVSKDPMGGVVAGVVLGVAEPPVQARVRVLLLAPALGEGLRTGLQRVDEEPVAVTPRSDHDLAVVRIVGPVSPRRRRGRPSCARGTADRAPAGAERRRSRGPPSDRRRRRGCGLRVGDASTALPEALVFSAPISSARAARIFEGEHGALFSCSSARSIAPAAPRSGRPIGRLRRIAGVEERVGLVRGDVREVGATRKLSALAPPLASSALPMAKRPAPIT